MVELSVVVPAYQEAGSIQRFLYKLDEALTTAGLEKSEVIVVDDGSSDGTADLARAVPMSSRLRVESQENRGRFQARRTGIEAAQYNTIMLIDCGLDLAPGAVQYLRGQRERFPDRTLWNGHVDIDTDGNPYAAFWSVIVRIFWGDYLRHPRLVSFGVEDFDRFPKGTTLFVAPADSLRAAVGQFSVNEATEKYASDDTRLIRLLLESHPRIWISPEFRCTYEARSTLRQFITHSTFRGTTFIDGYWESPSAFGRTVRTLAWVAVAVLLALISGLLIAPLPVLLILLLLVAVMWVLGFAAAVTSGSPVGLATRFAVLLPAFSVAFGLGAARGVLIRLRNRRATA